MQARVSLTLHWIEGRPGLSGGIKSNRLIAEAMARRGHRVTTFHLPPQRAWPPITQPRQFWKRIQYGIEMSRTGYRHHLEHAQIPVRQFPTHRLDPDFVPDADVVFASWWKVWREVAGWPASKGLKVHFVRGHETYNSSSALEEIETAYRLSGPKVVISSWLGRVMSGYGHSSSVRIPNGVDWQQFDSSPRSKQDVPTVGMLLGRGAVKGSETALEAARLIQEQIPESKVIAFGRRELPSHWNLPERFEFHCQPEQAMIPELYRRCDCWLVPSTSEGFGMPGLEAAAGHCPIVSTRCGGPEDYVRDGLNGFLVDVGDAQAMAERVVQVLRLDEDSWQRMSRASYEIAKEFDWDRSAEKLEAALHAWLAERDSSTHRDVAEAATR